MNEVMENRLSLAILYCFVGLCGVSAFIVSAILYRVLSPVVHNLVVAWTTLAGIGS